MSLRDELATYNERVKLRSHTLNALGLALIGFGMLRPLTDDPMRLGWMEGLWSLAGLAIHLLASYMLIDLRRRMTDDRDDL